MRKPVALIILDGYGYRQSESGNAVKAAKKPNLDKIMESHPMTYIKASGLDVGLPDGQMGNSEVGHLNIGSGRIVYQELTRITKSIADGDFFENGELLEAVQNAKEKDSAIHFMGLLSDGGVHSHINHLKGLLDLAKKHGLKEVYLHAYLDGRDTPPKSALSYIKEIQDYMDEKQVGKIATVSGRYYAMDRDNRWERVKLAYDALVEGVGIDGLNALDAVQKSYDDEKNDEFVLPIVIKEDGKPVGTIKDNDSVIFFNFRPDRARQLTRALTERAFDGFERKSVDTKFVCMTQYDATLQNVKVAFKPQTIENTLGEYLSKNNKTQLRIAETEKYAHVTFFFNGGLEEPKNGEDRILIDSPKVATYDLKPEMSAYEVTDALLAKLEENPYDVIVLNFANPDMVGHTGIFDAAVKAVETVDECVGRVVDKLLELDGTAIITADHGNSEQMVDEVTGKPFTAHTTNVVPCMFVSNRDMKVKDGGRLCDLAPTMLDIMGMEKPQEMTGQTLIEK